jgi:hypothetical protein
LTTEVSLDRVYEEVKRMRQQLNSIETSLDSLMESLIPEGEQLSPEEIKELETLSQEVKEGQCIPLEEVIAKHEGKKRAKIQNKRPQKSR